MSVVSFPVALSCVVCEGRGCEFCPVPPEERGATPRPKIAAAWRESDRAWGRRHLRLVK